MSIFIISVKQNHRGQGENDEDPQFVKNLHINAFMFTTGLHTSIVQRAKRKTVVKIKYQKIKNRKNVLIFEFCFSAQLL